MGETIKKISWPESVGTIAVVLSLVFVALEIRQANQLALVANVSAHYESFSAINEMMITDPEFAALLSRALASEGAGEFTETERWRLTSFLAMLLNTWIPANISYNHGQLAQTSFDALFDDARFWVEEAGPGLRELWTEALDGYPSLQEVEIVTYLRAGLAQPAP